MVALWGYGYAAAAASAVALLIVLAWAAWPTHRTEIRK